MPATERRPIPDAAARAAAIRERARNVLIDAGAGTGKTTIIVDRVVDLVAPAEAGVPPVPLERLAVLTFTRRAAGELRYRLRQKLLDTLRAAGTGARADLLRHALGVVDVAYVGTIHSFCDRLLRLYPVEAGISPSYEIAEDTGELVFEVFDRLCHGALAGRLAETIGPRDSGGVPVSEVEETVVTALAAGLRMETREHPWGVWAGLDLLVEGMIDTRDVPWVPEPWEPDLEAIRCDARDLATELDTVSTPGRGGRYLRAVAARLAELAAATSLPAAFRQSHDALSRIPRFQMKVTFENDKTGWKAYKHLRDEAAPALLDPLDRWMGVRIARMREVVAALYERVKEERGVVDQLDLLVKLRDLLRDDLDARAGLQSLFAHILVDEFQDTDPLQCEVVFFLAEDGVRALDWRDVRLRPGSLTVVGDPKQSIYRFRRADVRMYAEAHRLLREQGALPVSLVTNFRSRPGMLRFVNRQFERLFGVVEDGERFDAASGSVRYEPLAPDPGAFDAGAAVEVVPYTGPGGATVKAEDGRSIEASALARRIRWLVESGVRVRDPETDVERPARYGDVVVLAHVTTNVGSLLRELEGLGIRYSAHGGTLFLSDPLVRQYLLGLRSVADSSDGVAEAALLRPPFFGLDLFDVVSRRAGEDGDERLRAARGRLQAAREVLRELRRQRMSRPPVETTVDLIEHTALGRAAATGPNGRQALDTLYQIAYEVDRRAAGGRLDYDGATRLLRSWVTHPIKLDPPEATDPDAVRVMTIHGAKGLEFPIVVVWDGFAEEKAWTNSRWMVSRAGDGILIAMDRLTAEVPPGGNLLAVEKQQAQHERERLYYVAMTRARDLLVVPEPALTRPTGKMLPVVLQGAVDVVRAEPYRQDAEPPWARSAVGGTAAALAADEDLATRTEAAGERFGQAMAISGAPVALPVGVTQLAREAETAEAAEEEDDIAAEEVERVEKTERPRFGAIFGSTVHRAIQLGLNGAKGDARVWVRRAAVEYGLVEHVEDAVGDVERAISVVRGLGGQVMSEVPVVLAMSDGRMGVGFVDTVVVRDEEVVVLDYKTDAPPADGVGLGAYPQYQRQLGLYGEALRAAGVVGKRRIRTVLMFAGSGRVMWTDAP